MDTSPPIMTDEALAQLGAPKIAYVKEIAAGDLRDDVQGLDDMPDDYRLYAVHAADGTRVAVMTDFEAAQNAIRENSMQPVWVH